MICTTKQLISNNLLPLLPGKCSHGYIEALVLVESEWNIVYFRLLSVTDCSHPKQVDFIILSIPETVEDILWQRPLTVLWSQVK